MNLDVSDHWVAGALQPSTDWFAGIPPVVWSGVIGALVAAAVSVAGVVAANRASLARLRLQHEHDEAEADRQRAHDAKQRRDERKGAVRREVYAEAVESAHALLAAIGGLSQRGLDTSADGDALQAFLRANAKVWLVAEADDAHLGRELAGQFTRLMLHATTVSLPARQAMEPIRLREREIAHWTSEAWRLQSLQTDALARRAYADEVERISHLATEARTWVATLKETQARERAEAAPLHFAAFRDTFGELRAVQRSLWTFVSLLRFELDLPADLEAFLKQLETTEREAWLAVNAACGIDPPAEMPAPAGAGTETSPAASAWRDEPTGAVQALLAQVGS